MSPDKKQFGEGITGHRNAFLHSGESMASGAGLLGQKAERPQQVRPGPGDPLPPIRFQYLEVLQTSQIEPSALECSNSEPVGDSSHPSHKNVCDGKYSSSC